MSHAFGATAPPFIDYLKDILRRYPDGGQILKELIQNADDAGASQVVFIHDERTYGSQEDLGINQGPALYAFNDAVFTEDDWHGIQATGRSVKRDDPNKVGRFGIGFNSIYHITDVPCIFSSECLGLLDPQEKIHDRRPGFLWSLVDKEDQGTLMNAQFQPFQDIVQLLTGKSWENVIMDDQNFNGTLFRFPLRSEASEISDNLYNTDKVVQLFDSFIADADICPLFLRNVSSLSLIHIDMNDSINIRLKVTSSSPSTGLGLMSGADLNSESSTCFKVITSKDQEQTKTTRWLVTTCCMKEGNVTKLDLLAKKLCFRPQVDLAFQCGQDSVPTDGRLSCFLPLPNNESNKTGLPVYVNACFGLTDNRRHIKWQEEDQKYDEAAMWNELLIEEVLPLAYLTIIQDAINLSKGTLSDLSAFSVYGLWPNVSQTGHKEKWHKVAVDVLKRLFGANIPILSLAADEIQFVSPSEAVCPSYNSMAPEIMAAVTRTMIFFGEKLVTFPDHVSRAIQLAFPDPDGLKWVTPDFVRDVLHRDAEFNLSKEDKLCLLEYILSDGNYHDLLGLKLLPLSDGTFKSFTDKKDDFVLIDNNTFQRVLLPGCQTRFIPQDLSPTSVEHLRKLATRNLFTVSNLDAALVAELAINYVPKEWEETDGHVTWALGNALHPPLKWLQEFWKFLDSNFDELRHFIGMPLIPIESLRDGSHSKQLARLQQKPTLLFKNSKQDTLSDHVAEVIRKVGGTVVNRDECLQHQDLESYVFAPSPKSTLQVLMNLDAQKVIKGLQSASHTEKEELKHYLSSLGNFSVSEQKLVSQLPLFRSMADDYVAAQSKQAAVLSSLPKIPSDLPIPDSVVQSVTEADRRLLCLLHVDLLDSAQVSICLVDSIKMNYRKQETERIMTWILQNGSFLFSQNEDLYRRCADLSFIEIERGERKKASGFFDPGNKKFEILFDADFFPPQVFTQTPEMIKSLKRLGLLAQERDITPRNVLHVATQIEKLHVHSPQEAGKKSDTLLRLLNDNDLLSKFSAKQLHQLSQLQWIPCANAGAMLGNSKGCTKTRFFKPEEVRDTKYENLVGNVMPLTGVFKETVSRQLGLLCLPPAEKVLDNLSISDPHGVHFKITLHSTYKFMQDHMLDFIKVMLSCKPWLWIHNRFVFPRDVVLTYPPDLDLTSYIGKVPEEFLPYKRLLTEFGVRSCLSEKEIGDILTNIQHSIDERQPPFGNPSELKLSIAILNWMKKVRRAVSDDTPVPVMEEGRRFTLKPLSMALFCDVSRDGLDDLEKDQEEFYVIHEDISRVTAEWLKIPLLSTRILSPEYIGIEQCGQSEPITLRIKNILKEYDEDNDIFKELIQNAEDAGAKTCKFMVDFRKHKDPPESLISPGMSLCNGPCLWAFNDELFTDNDWRNITRVGSASKENQVEKIGKFGLGFNTVYHLTDIPSILSGDKLLILDPNVTHLEKHIKGNANPGIRLDLSRQQVLHRFSNQFKPYKRIFNCNLSKESTQTFYPGTLIKLPFRTQEEALKSEICSNVYDRSDIITFQQDFTNNSQTHLLFLKNINTVSLQNLPNNASTPPEDGQTDTLFTIFKKIVEVIPVDNTQQAKQSKALATLRKPGTKYKQVINYDNVNIAEITQQHCRGSDVQFWLLYNCFGTHQSLQMAQRENNQTKFSLPIAGIAVPLSREKQTGKWVKSETKLVGQAFCFLPLPIDTGLPVNVNGTFAVTSNRKGLWESGVKNQWNRALLEDAGTMAYVNVLQVLKNMAQNGTLQSYDYYTFWPNEEKVSKAFKPLVDAFYSVIAQPHHGETLELLSDGRTWFSMDKARFLHTDIEENKVVGKLATEVCQGNSKAPSSCHVVPLPGWVRQSFVKAGFGKILQERTLNWEEFYQQLVFNNLSTMDPKSRDALVLHAIDLNICAVDNLLRSYPCIPTQTEGQLQFIQKLVNPSGKAARLFEPEEGRFLGGTKNDFCSPKRIQRLLELGMLSDRLPLKEITERVRITTGIWHKHQEKAYKHLQCILELMRRHCNMQDEKDSPFWDTLRNTAFIPAFHPVNTNKESDIMVTLQKPMDVYTDKCRHLVNLTKCVVDHSLLKIHSDDVVLQKLRICASPPLDIVLQQLNKATCVSQNFDKKVLFNIAHECYKFLNEWLCDNQRDSPLISQRAHSFPFILVEDKFVHVTSVAECGEFDAKPYLHILPRAFVSFNELWKCVGISNQFTVQQFNNVLDKLSTQYGRRSLSKSDLQICFTIIEQGLYSAKETKFLPHTIQPKKQSACLIPDKNGVLQKANNLYYNDSPWIPVSGVNLCHENIPRVMALHFGANTTRHHTLKDHLVEDFSPYASEFGQHEELTVRIKNILSAYPSKKDILKELIQNADDAEATEIHFVWDKRKHSGKKTFGDRWNPLQGPALCVYNNKVFTDADMKGIQQLGEGGKHSIPGKTGKYGLGFNSVYHLTDCPSIITGDKWLCISDPGRKYIEGRKLPGCKFDLRSKFKEMFSDVYQTFLPDTFDLEKGTMFRLPFRMGANANVSKISQQGVTERDIQELCSVLSEDPEGLILFLKNIGKIQFHEINPETNMPKTIFSIEKRLPEKGSVERLRFQNHIQDVLLGNSTMSPDQAIYNVQILLSHKRESEWTIAEQFGSLENTVVAQHSLKVPQAALAACVRSKTAGKDFIGRAFCSLPLPGQTGLPIHVNGNFEVDASRRDLWKEDGKSVKADWNESLKLKIIAPLYADLLHHIRCQLKNRKMISTRHDPGFDCSFLLFFPHVSKDTSHDWHDMIHEVYRSVNERELTVIPILQSSTQEVPPNSIVNRLIKMFSFGWCSVTKRELVEMPYLADYNAENLTAVLGDVGMKLAPFSNEMSKIWESFKSAGVEMKTISPLTVGEYLRTKPMNDPTKTEMDLPLPINQTLIRDKNTCSILLNYCLKDVKPDNSQSISGLPLLLTQDHILRVFSLDSPKLLTRFNKLFCGYEKDFADDLFQNLHLLLKCFLKELTIPVAVKYLKTALLNLLVDCDVDLHSGLHVPNATTEKFLKDLWQFLSSQLRQAAQEDRDQNHALNSIMELFSDLPILPVVCPRLNNKHLLQTMSKMLSVIQSPLDDISTILLKLGFMKLNLSFFHKYDKELHQHLHSGYLDTRNESAVLDQVCQLRPSEFQPLLKEELSKLQYFLQSGISKSKDTQAFANKLKSLPLFETIQGGRKQIDGHKKVFILSTDLIEIFPDLYMADENIFLKSTVQNKDLAEKLKIKILNDLEYFVQFIMPKIHQLSEAQQINSVQLLLSLCLSELNECYDQIISTMSKVRLIRNAHGNLEMASYFFDENVMLYKIMLPQERFVPQGFWDSISKHSPDTISAKRLLKKLGMKCTVTDDEMINFAKQIESGAQGTANLNALKQKSSTLFDTILKNNVKKRSPNFMKVIGGIKFIYPVQIKSSLSKYHQAFATDRTTVAIRGSLIEIDPDHQNVIWTSMPILALPNNTQTNLQMMKDAGAVDKPPQERVTCNLKNICNSPCKFVDKIETRAEVFRQSYAYLQAMDFDPSPLTDLPLVLVEHDKELAKAKQTALVLPNHLDYRPYLYRIPPEDVKYEKFFKKIGVSDMATAMQYCSVLEEIHVNSSDKQALHANQLFAVKRAVQQLFCLLKESQSTPNLPQVLYLPSTDHRLYPSNTLYFNDTVFQASTFEDALKSYLRLLEKLSNCYLEKDMYTDQKLLQLLPEKLRPKMLSKIIVNNLVESSKQLCEDGEGCEFGGWFQKRLSSPAFTHGLICLIRHQFQGTITEEDVASSCQKTFGNIQIICCKYLETGLWLDQQLLGETFDVEMFVKKGQQCCSIYLKHNDEIGPKVMSRITMRLTKEINANLEHKLSADILPVLGELLMCDHMLEVLKTLEENGIHNIAKTEDFFPPKAGSVIPDEWLDALDMNILNNFEEGEYVGYKKGSDEEYVYAVIVEQLDTPPGISGRYFSRYKIQIGENEFIEVSTLDLHQFKREEKRFTSTGSTCMAVQHVAGPVPHEPRPSVPRPPNSSARSLPQSIEEVKEEIDECLSEIWILPIEERCKAIRRLYLRWHPDKNPDFQQLATEAFKYLKNKIEELESGKRSTTDQRQNTHFPRPTQSPKWNSNFSGFYHQWDQEANHHRGGRERSHRPHYSYYNNFWTHHGNVPQPNRAEAQRWFRQANCDLTAARSEAGRGSIEWCLFKVHQAVEKALIAAEYKRRGQYPTNLSISSMAEDVSGFSPQLKTLHSIVDKLKKIGVDPKKTQYPNCHPSPYIPNERFKSASEVQVLELASELLSKVDAFIF
ncbi:sacsin isoform X2 [Hypomesus transpacificus]|uniref:sacsin isoform X2 n=1 Tax=Hypomesus transpacificus TaxID=137520 RepID=UPI001F0715DD|nr:sacsin isoform X2 [Hypomesus transpacificus]